MTEHTRGPWVVQIWEGRPVIEQAQTAADLCQGEPDPRFVASVGVESPSTGWTPEDRANARLIAAAPALLEALKLAEATLERVAPCRPYDSTQGTRDVITAAIAAAEGR